MEDLLPRMRKNIIFGAIALFPLAALVFVLTKLFGVLQTLAEPLSPFLGTNPLLKTLLLLALTLFALLALCYLVRAGGLTD